MRCVPSGACAGHGSVRVVHPSGFPLTHVPLLAPQEDRHWSMHVLDMFTGRYLLQQCRTALRGTSSAATRLHR